MTTSPFVVGQWVRGDRFYGRRAQLEEILQGNRSWIWLLGTRRVGKTSLLKQLEHVTSRAPERGYFPVFWDFQGAEEPAVLHQYFADALLDAEERLEQVGIALPEVEADDVFSSLERLRRRLRSRNLALLLLCDEVEELIKLAGKHPALLSRLRRALQSGEDVRSVLASTVRLWTLAQQTADTSPFLHGFTPPLYIQALADAEARSLIQQDQAPAESRPRFDPDTAELIRSCCDNHPYLIQLVCKRVLETGDVEDAVEQVATDPTIHHFFSVDFEMLAEEERNALRVIAHLTAASSDSIQASVVADSDSLLRGLHRLEHLGFIRRNPERRFFVANYFFRRWLGQLPSSGSAFAPAPAPPAASLAAPGQGTSAITAEIETGSIASMLLHYRVLERLGAGGMGEVYAAEDGRLGRKVALKLLPPGLARDPERLERFEREARALAALNHPGIVTIYAVEQMGDVRFLTTELVEGQTLAELIAAGLPLERALRLFLALLEALAAAHAQGIVHRDLKPANIMVTKGEQVKLLDFGIAAFKPSPLAVVDVDGDTRTLTAPGRLLGTLPYMSPEQVQGGRVDARSDLFSLGVVVYEALTGTRPFRGKNAAELMSAILRDTPQPITALQPAAPPQLDRIVARCLEKDPAARYQSVAELRGELDSVVKSLPAGGVTGVRRWLRRLGAPQRFGCAVLVAAATALIAGLILWL